MKASEAFAHPLSNGRRIVGAQHSRADEGTDPSQFRNLGRYAVTRERKHLGAFKTPTLRDVELTSPYMHDGSIKALLDVVKFYNRGGETNPNLDPELRPLNLTDAKLNNLVEFLRSLTSDDVLKQVQTLTPQTRLPAASDH